MFLHGFCLDLPKWGIVIYRWNKSSTPTKLLLARIFHHSNENKLERAPSIFSTTHLESFWLSLSSHLWLQLESPDEARLQVEQASIIKGKSYTVRSTPQCICKAPSAGCIQMSTGAMWTMSTSQLGYFLLPPWILLKVLQISQVVWLHIKKTTELLFHLFDCQAEYTSISTHVSSFKPLGPRGCRLYPHGTDKCLEGSTIPWSRTWVKTNVIRQVMRKLWNLPTTVRSLDYSNLLFQFLLLHLFYILSPPHSF